MPPPLYDFWVWDYWWNSGKLNSFELNLIDVDSGAGIVTSHLLGYNKLDGVSSNHHVRVYCNEELVSDLYFTGWDQIEINSSVTNLINGVNTIAIEQVLDTGNISVFVLQSFDISYSRKIISHNDALSFAGGTYSNITVDGFSTNKIDPARVFR